MRFGKLPKDDERCGWYEMLEPPQAPKRASGDLVADYAIIGGGITGLSIALRLASAAPSASVIVLEASRVGLGPSGRNSGFVAALPNFMDLLRGDEPEQISNTLKMNQFSISQLRSWVSDYKIACDWDESGRHHVAAMPANEKLLKRVAKEAGRFEIRFETLDRAAIKTRIGTDYYPFGLLHRGGAQLQPAALIRGLARSLPKNVTLFEETPVLRARFGAPHELEFPGGRLRAKTVFVANNAFAGLLRGARETIIPLLTFASLTRPLSPDEARALGGLPIWSVLSANGFGTTMRRMRDNRVLIRNVVRYGWDYTSARELELVGRWAYRRTMLPSGDRSRRMCMSPPAATEAGSQRGFSVV